MSKCYYKRWVGIGDGDVDDIVRLVQEHMDVMCVSKPGFCFWWGLYLYGTREQMARVQDAWERVGMDWHSRQPPGAWAISKVKISEHKPLSGVDLWVR